jgi:alpha-1,3-fucosyltransferase
MAVWAVTQCDQPSRRHVLGKELQKYIDVDIYGRCGNFSCPRYPKKCVDYTKIYKFYFSFENSLCDGYITEKLFKVLNEYIIPVVYNGSNMTNFLPPKSYVDANSFATPKDLATHLKILANDPEEYVKYFWWREHYDVSRYSQGYPDVCKMVNERRWTYKTQVYGDINKWFNGCSKPKIKFE